MNTPDPDAGVVVPITSAPSSSASPPLPIPISNPAGVTADEVDGIAIDLVEVLRNLAQLEHKLDQLDELNLDDADRLELADERHLVESSVLFTRSVYRRIFTIDPPL